MPSLGSSLCNKGDGATTMILSITGEHASVEAKVNGVVVSMPCILRANDAVVLTATPDTHYRMQLDSWSGLPASATFSADYKTASFIAQDRVVGFCAPFHYEAVVSGTVSHCGVASFGVYTINTSVTLTATPDAHYHMEEESWAGLPSTTVYSADFTTATFTITDDVALTASALIDKYTVITVSNHGTCTGAGEYEYNTDATVRAFPDEHYHWQKWTVNGVEVSTDNPYTFTVTEDVTITAVLPIDQHVISCSIINGTATGAGTYDYGSQVVLSVTANEHYHWQKWDDGISGNPRTITVLEDKFYSATCPIDTHEVVVNAIAGSATGGGTYEYGEWCRVFDTAAEHYHFVNWKKDGAIISTTNPYEFQVLEDTTLDALNEIDEFTITTTIDHGTCTGAGTYEYGQSCTLLITPEAHYHFDKWDDGSLDNPRAFIVTQDLALTSSCEIDTHTVNATGVHGTVVGGGTFNYGQTCTLVVTPESSQYAFATWSDGNTDNPRLLLVDKDYELVATCAFGTMVISATAFNGTTTGSGSYEAGDTCVLTVAPVEHYHFESWDDGNTDNPRSFVVSESKTFTANCEIDEVVVTATATDGSISGDGTFHYNDPVSLACIPNEHYHFVKWNDDNTDNPRAFTATEDVTYSTACAIDTFNLVAYGIHGTVSPASGTYDYGSSVILTVTPDTHYKFVAWEDGNTDNPRTITITKDEEFTAHCTKDEVTISTTGTHATVTGAGTYRIGATVTLHAVPEAHYHMTEASWVGITGATFSSDYTSCTFTADLTRVIDVTAVEDTKYTLTFNAQAHGSVSPTTYTNYPGETVSVTATADADYKFTGWADGCNLNPRTFTVGNADATYTANFAVITYELTFIADGHGTVTATVDGTAITSPAQVVPGTEVVLTDTPADGWRFREWNDGITTNPRTFTMPNYDTEIVGVNEEAVLSFNSDEFGAVTATVDGVAVLSPCRVLAGATVVLTDTASLGYKFKQWSDGVTDNPRTYTMTTTNASFHAVNELAAEYILLEGNASDFTTFQFTDGANVEVSDDSVTWTSLAAGSSAPVTNGKLYVRGKTGSTSLYGFKGSFSKVSGNIMTLVDYENYDTVALNDNQFTKSGWHGGYGLFSSCTSLVDASELTLPRTVLRTYCYQAMFFECTSLTSAPALPATTIAQGCYQYMFFECTSLTSAPALPATTLAYYCYDGMFGVCTSLTSAPALPATTIAQGCYSQMFRSCTSLTSAPSLPALTLADSCYSNMFKNCTSLTSAPSLPSTSLVDGCYANMFYDCTSLTTAPSLPATTLADYCYEDMFYGCTSLTGPVNISAASPYSSGTTSACEDMFTNAGTVHKVSEHVGEDCIKINLPDGADKAAWRDAANIDPTYWDVPRVTLLLEGNASTFTTFKFNAGANIEVSDDGSTWTSLSAGTSKSVSNGKLYVRGKTGSTSLHGFKGKFTKVSGNIMTLVDYENYDTVALNDNQFTKPGVSNGYGLFSICTSLVDASELTLPRTVLRAYCYRSMFYNCYSLTTPPALPATTLAQYCYFWMFSGCSSLTSAPALPATTLAQYCYYSMFSGCTSLTSAPSLPATTLAYACYQAMFSKTNVLPDCSNIDFTSDTVVASGGLIGLFGGTKVMYSDLQSILPIVGGVPSLPVTTLAQECYSQMFSGCTSLTSAPALPALTLVSQCYRGMFYGCTSLTSAPALPATTLASGCYYYMFENCTALTSAPSLPATTLATTCYGGMFSSCTSLTSAPSLPALTLADSCYSNMFKNCTSLTGPVRISATTPYYTGTTTACADMFANAGTAEGSGGTICVGDNVSLWNSTNCGITTPHTTKNWDVSLLITNYITLEGDPSTFTAFRFTSGANIYVSDDGVSWTSLSAGTSKSVSNGKLYVAGKTGSTPFYGTAGRFSKVSGNIMSLVDYDNVDTCTLSANQFAPSSGDGGLFYNITSLVDASGLILPRTSLTQLCYKWMFYSCSALTSAPALPASTLAKSCYSGMFNGCTSLITPPALPATTLAIACYEFMFGSSGIESAPALPATTLPQYCYYGMFSGCTSLTVAPALPGTTFTGSASYKNMFKNCTNLVTPPPALPATSLYSSCYDYMFQNCTSLTGPIKIYATSAPSSVWTDGMFTNSGTSRPSTPAGYRAIMVAANVSSWNSANAGINSTYWSVSQLIS